MGDITIKIHADSSEAVKAFTQLSESSTETRKKMEAYAESYGKNLQQNMEGFINRNKLLESAIIDNKSALIVLNKEYKNCQNEIQRLTRAGLNPNHEAIVRLRQEQINLRQKIKDTTAAQEAQTKVMKNAERAVLGCIGIIAAGVVALGKAVNDASKDIDSLSESGKKNAEEYIKAQEKLQNSLKGVRNELAEALMPSLTKIIEKAVDFIDSVDDWEQVLKNTAIGLGAVTAATTAFVIVTKGHTYVTAMASAIKVLNVALTTTPVGLIAAAIAAFAGLAIGLSNTVKQIEQVHKDYEANIKKMKKANEDLLANSNSFDTIRGKVQGLTEDMYNAAKATGEYAKALQNVERINELRRQLYKLSEESEKNTEKFKLQAKSIIDILSEPINPSSVDWVDEVLNGYTSEVSRLEAALTSLYSSSRHELAKHLDEKVEGWVEAVASKNSEAILAMLQNVSGESPAVKAEIDRILKEIADLQSGGGIGAAVASTVETTASDIQKTLQQRLSEISLTENQLLNDRINQISSFLEQRANLEGKAGEERIAVYEDELRRMLEGDRLNSEEKIAAEEAAKKAILKIREGAGSTEEPDKTFLEMLESTLDAEKQAQYERLEIARNFLKEQAELETNSLEEKLSFFERQKEALYSLYEEGSNERIAIEEEIANAIIETENQIIEKKKEAAEEAKKLAEEERKQNEMRVQAVAGMFGSISSLIELAEQDNIGALAAKKAMAMIEAAINSSLAFTQTLASGIPYPLNLVSAGSVLAAGLAQQVKIASAETGGRFVVPYSTGVDNTLMRVNSNEVVDIRPAGMAGKAGNGESFNFSFNFEGTPFANIINTLAQRGELYQLSLSGNL